MPLEIPNFSSVRSAMAIPPTPSLVSLFLAVHALGFENPVVLHSRPGRRLRVASARAQPSRVSSARDPLAETVETLFETDGGCPWTASQSSDDFVKFARSELDEVEEAIAQLRRATGPEATRAATEHLSEEIGDLLFATYMLAGAARRDLGAAAEPWSIASEKMRARTPYMDWDGRRRTSVTAEEAAAQWARVKRAEKTREERL